MFLECSSVTEMGRLRVNNPGKRLITTIRMKCLIEFEDYDVLFLMPNYNQSAIRLIFEILDGIRLDSKSEYAPMFEDALNKIDKYNNLEIDSSEFRKELEIIYRLRMTQQEYGECILDEEIFRLVIRFVSGLGGITLTEPFFSKSPYIKKMQPLASVEHVLNLCFNRENFLKNYNALGSSFSYCSIGDRVIYPEDFYAVQYITHASVQRHTNGLYYEFKSFAEFLDESDLTDGQRALFQQTSCTCGGELILRSGESGYTTLSCVNLHCKNKILWSVATLAKNLGMLGIGAQSLAGAVENLWITRAMIYGESKVTYADLLTDEFTNYLDGNMAVLYGQFLDRIRSFNGLTKELVKLSGLPYVGEYAGNVITRDALEQVLDFHSMLRICQGSKVKNLRVIYSLYMYLEDIRHLISMSKCKDCSGVAELNICITRAVTLRIPGKDPIKFKNKQDFVDFLNLYIEEQGIGNVVRVVKKDSMSSKVHVLVSDAGVYSQKVRDAQNSGIRVVKSYDVFECIKEVAQENGYN